MKRLWWSLVCVLALGVTSACDGGSTEADSGPPEVDSGPELAPVVTVDDGTGEQVPADFDCRGTPTAPAGSGEITFPVVARSFGDTGDPDPLVDNITVQFFPNNEVPADATCTPPCVEVTTDSSGMASVTDADGSWYAYRIPAATAVVNGSPTEFVDVVHYNETALVPSGMSEERTLNAVAGSTVRSILALLGTSQEEGTGAVTGPLLDCAGREVSNARIRVFDSVSEIELTFADSGPREFYFNGSNFPNGRRQSTNEDGLFGAANLPIVGDRLVRVELWGVTAEGEDAEMLGCERVQINAGGITIVNIGPTRADGPSDCSGS